MRGWTLQEWDEWRQSNEMRQVSTQECRYQDFRLQRSAAPPLETQPRTPEPAPAAPQEPPPQPAPQPAPQLAPPAQAPEAMLPPQHSTAAPKAPPPIFQPAAAEPAATQELSPQEWLELQALRPPRAQVVRQWEVTVGLGKRRMTVTVRTK